MTASITIKPTNVASFPDGGGHLWVFLQYVDGLRQLGCDVFWLERFEPLGSEAAEARALHLFRERMERFGLADKSILYRRIPGAGRRAVEALGSEQLLSVTLRTDLLLNFDYSIEAELIHGFDLTALVDIDPGLVQFWVSTGQLPIQDHDLYLTTGETVGRSERINDLGKEWIHFRPPVSVRLWPYTFDPEASTLTTVSGWWGGGGKGEWVTDGVDLFFENNKRVSFLEMLELPQLTDQRLELALALGEGDQFIDHRHEPTADWKPRMSVPPAPTDYVSDDVDRAKLMSNGWNVRHAEGVAGGPTEYQSYIQRSRGEFSCAKPSCMFFQNAWISDRTLCYLATGKPAIVQDTGPSTFLPSGEGLFRFSDMEGALAGIEALNANYQQHCEAARELACSRFDAPIVLEPLLDRIFSGAD